ncbi:MAG TPA: SIMPL domain-containing protein [Thermoanaerobaculia bacterium]|nr:SIMPL domain-containing protein [Thermoanaerobaculia bacterium]
MKRFLGFIIIIEAIAASAFAQTQMPVQPETISVSGTARVSVAPDRFTFVAGVQTAGPSVDAAVNENNAKTASVIAALKKAGATDRDIRTSNFSIYPQQDYREGQLPRILGYQVSNNITVTRANIAEAGKLLQAAISAGVNTSSGLQFEVSDPARGRDQGLKAAFDDARSKASALAQAAGRTVGRAISISEGTQPAPPMPFPRVMAMKAEAQSVSEVPVESGAQELTFNVAVVFELR